MFDIFEHVDKHKSNKCNNFLNHKTKTNLIYNKFSLGYTFDILPMISN